VPSPGSYDIEAGRAGPIDVFANQGRLVAPRQAIDDAGRLCLARQQGSRDDVGFDTKENEVVIVSAQGERRVEKAPKEAIAAAILDEVEHLI